VARLSRSQVVAAILDVGLLPVFYHGEAEVAMEVVEACYRGGVKAVEFTNRGPRALTVFKELTHWRDEERPDLLLGAGTVSDSATAASYINAGADYIVGPTHSPSVAEVCQSRGVLYIPGCFTPTEIWEAQGGGAEIVKLFPASVVTPKFVKALRGPMPHALLMPSGGVKAEEGEVVAWLRAGAAALNIGSDLVRKDLVEAGDFDGVRERVEMCLGWIREARRHG